MAKSINRREFVSLVLGSAAASALPGFRSFGADARQRLNLLLITTDDLNYDSLGCNGCTAPDITPNLDRLASEGMRFSHSHVTIAVCQPCREVLMTGRYPHRNGALGFEPIDKNVPTLQEQLHRAGYLNGILGKVGHLAPRPKFCWDTAVDAPELGQGRDPQLYYAQAKRFLDGARESGRPFFLMANSHDPHRPFAGSLQEQIRSRGKKKRRRKIAFPEASRYYKPEEVQVPGFLPDIPDVRKEVAQYFSSVHRCDMTAGAILRALRECGFQDNTLVLFLGDHGMAFPYAKTNCYRASTLSPWIVRWPGVVKPGTLDREHFVSGVDYMPTMLEAAGLAQVDGMDGHSFLPVLKGKRQDGRETVFTVFNKTSGKREYPMRAIQNKRFGYIFNAWSDGKTAFRNESQSGLTFNAMKLAAKNDKAIARRVDFFLHRVPEELYDYENDPSALTNLADRPEYGKQLKELRAGLLKEMEATSDPVLPAFRKYLAGRA